MKRLFFIILIFLSVETLHAYLPKHSVGMATAADFIPKTVILKIKDGYRAKCSNNQIDIPALNRYLSRIGASGLAKKFLHALPPVQQRNIRGESYADISLIYEFRYSADMSIEKVINAIYSLGIVEYAQPHYLAKPLYIPNDPLLSDQYYLTNIQAFAGWDISQGDTNIVIGITDTGIDSDHPDLTGNIKYNYADTIDGIDNDNDGYIDNYRGWDLADNDNDPTSSGFYGHHGTRVAGLAAGATDNGPLLFNISFT